MAALLCAKDLCKTYVIDKRQNNVLKNVNLEQVIAKLAMLVRKLESKQKQN